MIAIELITVHALAWLVLANGIGLLLATLLLWPELGSLLAPFTYGRWAPLHLDFQLYGWSALPLVGLILHVYGLGERRGGAVALGVSLWSGALLFAGIQWLAGGSSGKLFLEWTDAARALLCAGILFTAVLLVRSQSVATAASTTPTPAEDGSDADAAIRPSRALTAARWAGLALLSSVPFVLFWAGSTSVYPSINPHSGGATGAALLGSSLAVVAILVLFPLLLGFRAIDGGRATRGAAVLLLLHATWFAMIDHGDVSHRAPGQSLVLASLAVWLPLLIVQWRTFDWASGDRRWLVALAFWGAMLLATGIIGYLPGVLETWKFTNAFVAHAHIAMAGLITSFNAVLLTNLNRPGALSAVFADGGSLWRWNTGLLVFAVSLLALGTAEGLHPGLLFERSGFVTAAYGLRLAGGLAMTAASIEWLRNAIDGARGAWA